MPKVPSCWIDSPSNAKKHLQLRSLEAVSKRHVGRAKLLLSFFSDPGPQLGGSLALPALKTLLIHDFHALDHRLEVLGVLVDRGFGAI